MDNTPFDAVRRSPKPVVSAINGLTQGGGPMIAMLSDVAVASDRATFRAPELFRGIADTNYAQVLPRQIGPARARDMLLTGRVVSAAEALDWGLVARVVDHDALVPTATDVLRRCCRTAPDARSEVKRAFDRRHGTYDRMAMDASIAGDETAEGCSAPPRSGATPRGSSPTSTPVSASDRPAGQPPGSGDVVEGAPVLDLGLPAGA
jgi:enoyl-CoA hydratase/carnithine racemase